MKIFFTVLIIVLILLIAIRFIALQFYTTEENKTHTTVINAVTAGLFIGLGIAVVGLAMYYVPTNSKFFYYGVVLFIGIGLAIFLMIAHLTLVMPIVLISTGIVRKKKAPIIVASAVWVPIYTVLIIFFLGFPPKYPLLNPAILFQDYEGIVRIYGEPTYNDGDVLCYRTEVWWYQCSYYCVKLTPNGRAYFAYYDDLYDSKWILGRSREEIDARFPENWYVGAGNVYYHVRGENSGTYYAVKYGDNNTAIDFWTDDSVP